MRQGYEAKFVEEGNRKIGVYTGADFCAEHEWGIKRLRADLGMDDTARGVACRTILNPKAVGFYSSQTEAVIAFGDIVTFGYWKRDAKEYQPHRVWERHPTASGEDGKLYTEWDGTGCLIAVKGEDNVRLLKGIFEACQNKRGYLALSGRPTAFANGGLLICAVDDIPQADKDAILAHDLDYDKLQETHKTLGIEEKLRPVRKWFSLKPRWASQSEKEKTKYPIVYWLNPMEQNLYNAGWFSIEDLEQWIAGEGPIIRRSVNK